jgi:hypothetical protein
MPHMMIFVSHSHNDDDYRRELVATLREAGANVWYDEHNLQPGQLTDVVQREIERRPVFLVILSKVAFSSHWVRRDKVDP